eukprot:CAMPEP_0206535230 /NCGR_PEP_ID=MMETSP0325_2-20121206/6009_1 /ASSEMBLY_ACC=CAM_ASM_000347 /TAXON_ID=2866 /ORGANISM="Crypthecodinium cohnii, Strain Seligo" /LENGTH=75 /DNA_ID=CAMNT_0054032169 /DNA_START=275 /DNA_END=503 /DNA_ORIENTATION=-
MALVVRSAPGEAEEVRLEEARKFADGNVTGPIGVDADEELIDQPVRILQALHPRMELLEGEQSSLASHGFLECVL